MNKDNNTKLEALIQLATDKDLKIREAIANREHLTEDVIRILAVDKSTSVRKTIAERKDIPEDLVRTFTATKYTYKYVNGVKVTTPTATTDVTASADWSSSSTGVATVTAGTVKGIASGTATITATINKGTANEKSHSVTVTIADVITYSHSLTVTPESASIKIKGTQAFTATYYTYTLVNGVKDDTKTTSSTVTSTATWSSNKTSVATVSAGTATGKGEGTATITATYEGSSDTATITVSDDIESYADPVVTLSYSPATVATAGGTATPTVTYSQTVTYLSGKTETLTTGGTVTYSGSATGFSLAADGKVTAEKNTGVARSITVTAKVAMNGKTGSKTATVSQNGDGVSSYDDPVVTLSYSPNPMGAAAGTSTPTVTYTQTVHYSSGETGTVTTGGTVTYSGSASGFTVNSSTGVVSATANTGVARSVEVTATVTLNGKTGTKKVTVSQSGDSVSSYDNPVVTLSYSPNPMGAAAGNATPTLSYSQTATYASGKTETLTTGGTVSYSGSASGFTVNSTTGIVSATANTGTARSVEVTATVTLNGKTGTKKVTISQSGDSVSSYDNPVVTLSYSPNPMPAAAGTSTPTVTYTQTVHYASGETGTVTTGGTVSYSGSASGFSVNSSTGVVTAEKNTGNERSVTVTATVAVNGKSATKTATVTQSKTEEDRIVSAGDITITEFSYSPETIDASGGTSTPTVKYSQTVTYESGTTKTLTQEDVTAELNFTGEAEGFTVNSSTGVVSATKNTDIERSVNVVVTVALNGKIKTARATVKQESKLIMIHGEQSGSDYLIFSSVAIPYPDSVEVGFKVAYPTASGTAMCPDTYHRTIKSRAISPNPQFTAANVGSWPSAWPSDAKSPTITGGEIVSVSPTTVGEYTVKFHGGDFIKSYDNPVITLNSSTRVTVDRKGAITYNLINLFNISCSQTERWNSGNTTENTDVAMHFYGSNSAFTINSNTGVLTTQYNGTGEERSIDITVVATANGKISTRTFTVYQMK